jgi:prepilin-type processing-associated H-X9-DG protein
VANRDISSSYNSSSALFYFSSASASNTGSATSGPARAFVTLERPSQVILVTEGKQAGGSGGSCQSSVNWTQVRGDLSGATPAATTYLDFRHDVRMNALYADGHVSTIPFKDRASTIVQSVWEGRTF